MKHIALACLFVFLTVANALALDPHEGFGKYKFGDSCQELFSGPSFAIEQARPVWDEKVRVFGLEYDPQIQAKSPIILHYDKDEKPSFEGIPLGRVFYGCDKNTGRFSLVILSHDLLAVPQLVEKATAIFGEPTQRTMVQTIWALPDIYVQVDQVFMIIYDRRAGHPAGDS